MALFGVLPPRNPLTDCHKPTQNLAEIITPGTPLNTPNGMSVSSGGDLHVGVKY